MKIWLFIIFFISMAGCSIVSVFADSASNSLSLSLEEGIKALGLIVTGYMS